ncbi:MAG: aromatic ring hydroxylase [Desulfobacterales bacterium RIFOXYA12_FULL_46_15]|nr:MAG: aromatic ring hydroxylase [Desulfobacterales bacterium RIFOXYA12_FULL_46_15]
MRTKEQFHDNLAQMRPNVYIGGEKVGRDDPRLLPGIRVYDMVLDLAGDPEWKGVATVKSPLVDKEINRFCHLPQTPQDLIQKQKLIRLGARRAGGCVQRCMGLDGITALAVCTKEIDMAKGTDYHERFLKFMRYYQENELAGCCAQTDSKGDRMKRPFQQNDPNQYVHIVERRNDGIMVSGYKMSITTAPYAEEMIVIPTRALGKEDADYAVAFAIPPDTEGISLVTRPVWHRDFKDGTTSPFCKLGVSDSLVIFDNVFIPNDRVFMCGEWDFGRRIALLFANSHRHSYCGCKPAISDILCGATILAAEANNIMKASHIKEKLTEFAGASALAYAAGIAATLFGKKTDSGVFFPNPVYSNVGRRLSGELVYHEYNILTEVAGGIAVTMPFHEDFKKGDNVDHLNKFILRNPQVPADESLKIWKFVEELGTSAMSAWYKVAGVHGGGSPIMETISLGLDYDFEDKKNVARYLAGIDETLDDSRMRQEEPVAALSPDAQKEVMVGQPN